MLRASCLKKFRCYEVKIEKRERRSMAVKLRTPLALAASALPLCHDSWTTTSSISQSSVCTAQVILNARVPLLATPGLSLSSIHLNSSIPL